MGPKYGPWLPGKGPGSQILGPAYRSHVKVPGPSWRVLAGEPCVPSLKYGYRVPSPRFLVSLFRYAKDLLKEAAFFNSRIT